MTTATLFDRTVPRTLDTWVARFEQPEWHGARIDGWLFEGAAARRTAEGKLRAAGVQATLRSAYKPLLHHFLEEVDCSELAAVTVHYPVHPLASPRRFALETYPLAALLPDGALQLLPGTEDLSYQVALTTKSGQQRHATVFAPNRSHLGCSGATLLSPTGWLRVQRPSSNSPDVDEAQQTEYEAVFDHVLETVQHHDWPAREPFFERLDLRVDIPGSELKLPVGDECISTLEALHEDIYFSLLELFQERSGRAPGDRRLQPGQIVPNVRAHEGPARVRIFLASFDTARQPLPESAPPDDQRLLESFDCAPSLTRVADEIDRMPGQRFEASSVQGRRVRWLYHPGPARAVFISAGQHANETSGVVGALRAARALHEQGDANFALLPLENPDGYALHRELCTHNPLHMQHAARYTALGDDVEYREEPPLYERAARVQALALSGAQLHINLHGYPAHEWTRPLSGYLPQGFELWTIPKGFFLLLRHHKGRHAEGRQLLEQVCAALAGVPGLLEYNARQLALYQQHAGAVPFELVDGTACLLSQLDRPGAPVTLITEFPDETLRGEPFRFAHTVQMQAALAAVRAWQSLERA